MNAPRRWDPTARVALAAALSVILSSIAVVPVVADEVVVLGETIGEEIDREEQMRFALFPDLPGFVSGRLVRRDDGRLDLEYEIEEKGRRRRGSIRVSAESLDLTRRHVRHIETLEQLRAESGDDADLEARILQRMALRYGLERRWDLAVPLLDEVRLQYRDQYEGLGIAALLEDARRLRDSPRPLFREGALLDRSGRTEVLVFAGYYGVWLGFAVPIALEASSPEPYSLSLLLLPTTSLTVAHLATRYGRVTDGDADLVRLAAHFGTWQGLGWAGVADQRAEVVVGHGILWGLAGIGAASFVAMSTDHDEGDIALVDAGMGWGAWFGMLGAILTESTENDGTLTTMLVGSDLGVVAGALWAPRSRMTEKRVRLMNLAGVLGGVAGLGFVGLVGVDDDKAAVGFLGAGSVVGALIAISASRPESGDLELRAAAEGERNHPDWTLSPRLGIAPAFDGRMVPRAELRATF